MSEVKNEVLEAPEEDKKLDDEKSITGGEKPLFKVELATWSEEGEVRSIDDQPVTLSMSKNRRDYQRGIMELEKDGVVMRVGVDALLSCVYTVYETDNPMRFKQPEENLVELYAVAADRVIQEKTETEEEQISRKVLAISVDPNMIFKLKKGFEEEKPVEGTTYKALKMFMDMKGHEEMHETNRKGRREALKNLRKKKK